MNPDVWARFLSDGSFRKRKAYRYRAVDGARVKTFFDSSESDDELRLRLEERIARAANADHAVVTGSGLQAFSLVSKALVQRAQREIALQAYTCRQLAPLAREAGLRVRLLDVDLSTGNVSSGAFVAQKGRAYHAIHSFGNPLDLEDLASIAKRGTTVVEDCAHALGARFHGRPVGGVGWASIFSFRKNLSAGSGGALTTSDAKLAAFARATRGNANPSDTRGAWGKRALAWKMRRPSDAWPYALYSRYEYSRSEFDVFLPSRLDTAITLDQLGRVDEINAQNRSNAAELETLLGGAVSAVVPLPDCESACTRYGFVFARADAAKAFLRQASDAGFETGMHYADDFLQNVRVAGSNPEHFPNSVQASARLVPVGLSGLSEGDLRWLADRARTVGTVGN